MKFLLFIIKTYGLRDTIFCLDFYSKLGWNGYRNYWASCQLQSIDEDIAECEHMLKTTKKNEYTEGFIEHLLYKLDRLHTDKKNYEFIWAYTLDNIERS
jgi:hypothetical protein